MSLLIMTGIIFWSVQDTIALKVNHSDERERSDKKAKISILKEWQENQTSIIPGVLIIKFKPTVKINKGAVSSNQMLLNTQMQRAGVQTLTPVVSSMKK
jgi:hypothetical protein